jgi:hypothetical protein
VRSGIELDSGRTFECDAFFKDTGIIQWQTQVAVQIVDGPVILAAMPASGPSDGRFETSTIEFWQEAGRQ